MKQTNNAIKFLMAQYRAIFRNANLKMFLAAATAAAAMAAGSAQAAPTKDGDTLTNALLKEDIAGDTSVTVVVNGDGKQTDGTYTKVTLTGAATGTPDLDGKEFTIKITSGSSSTIDGTDADNKKLTASSGALVISGGAAAADTALEIGKANAAAVTLKSVDVSKGTLKISNGSSLTASDALTFGTDSALTITDGIVTAGAVLNDGAKVTITKGSLGGTGNVIEVNTGATVTGDGANPDEAKLVGTVNVKGGTVTAADKKLTIDGDLNVETGEFATQAGGEAKVTGLATFTGNDSFNNAGTAILAGNSIFADKSVKAAGTVKLGGTATMNKATLLKLIGGTEVAAIDGKNAVIDLSAEPKVDLAGDANGLINSGDGVVNAKLKNGKGGSLTIKGNDAQFTASGAMSGAIGLDFDTYTLGKTNAIDIKGGLTVKVGKTLTIDGGDANGALKLSSGTLTLHSKEAEGKVVAKTINLAATGAANTAKLDVTKGNWSVTDLTLTKGQATIDSGAGIVVGGTLAVTANGTLDVKSGSFISAVGNGSINFKDAAENSIKLSNSSKIELDSDDILKGTTIKENTLAKNAISGDGSTFININNETALTAEQFKNFKDAVGTSFKGVFNMKVDVGDVPAELTTENIIGQISTNKYDEKTLNVASGTPISETYSVGNVKVKADENLTLGAGGGLVLNTADKTNKNFVTKVTDKGDKVAGVKFTDASNALTLVGSGNIGAIETTAAGGSFNVGIDASDEQKLKSGDVTIAEGNIGTDQPNALRIVRLSEDSSLKLQSGDIFATNLTLGKNSVLDVNGNITTNSPSIMGKSLTAKKLTIIDESGTVNVDNRIAGGAEVRLEELSVGAKHNILIGEDGVGKENGTTAQVYTGSLKLAADSVVFVDPGFGQKAALLVADSIDTDTSNDGASLGAHAYVGKNAAIGIGFTEAEFNALMGKYLVNKEGFEGDKGLHNALVLNKPISIKDNKGITVSSALTKDNYTDATTYTKGNTLVLGTGSAVILTSEAIDPAKGAIHFEGNSGKIEVLAQTQRASELDALSDGTPKFILEGNFVQGNDYKLATAGSTNKAASISGTVAVEAYDGLLYAVLTGADSTFSLKYNDKKESEFRSGISAPIGQLYIDVAKGNLDVDLNTAGGKLYNTSKNSAEGRKKFDAAAHAATYAGAQQAAVAAVGTMAEAVGGRVGSMGVEVATISATGSQANGGVWLSPMYKSVDADGFNAEGASYGADVDLGGVAFGADTVNGNMRFGAVFNIGSGDADGKGNGNGLKDEFDYYGFGMYTVMGFGQFALVGDASLNVISHDVKGLDAKASADTTAVTMGVTGQYTISNPAVDVTPHVGARFIRLDTDSYDLNTADGVLAQTDFDVQNVFSVPLGVTLSKAFEMGGWSLAPSADLSITFNTGDTDVKSTTRFDGIKRDIGLTTEVLDEVTYGVAVGLGAQYGAFGTNIGINYTGSSNTDAFGVNANARYMF